MPMPAYECTNPYTHTITYELTYDGTHWCANRETA